MEKHVQVLLNKISYASITIATLTLLLFCIQTPQTCFDSSDPNSNSHTHFPKSTCDLTHRPYASIEKRNHRLWSTKAWVKAVSSYTSLFRDFYALGYISNQSHILIVSAGPGQAVQALNGLGVEEITAVEVVESPPLVSRADPHNLPFFDGSFDLGFGVYLDRALFPKRYVEQIERTVKIGGLCVVSVDQCDEDQAMKIVRLFSKSQFVASPDVYLAGERRTAIVMRVN